MIKTTKDDTSKRRFKENRIKGGNIMLVTTVKEKTIKKVQEERKKETVTVIKRDGRKTESGK